MSLGRALLGLPALNDADVALAGNFAQCLGGAVVGRIVAIRCSLQSGKFDYHRAGAHAAFDHGLPPGADEEPCTKLREGCGDGGAVLVIGGRVGDGDMGDPIGFWHDDAFGLAGGDLRCRAVLVALLRGSVLRFHARPQSEGGSVEAMEEHRWVENADRCKGQHNPLVLISRLKTSLR